MGFFLPSLGTREPRKFMYIVHVIRENQRREEARDLKSYIEILKEDDEACIHDRTYNFQGYAGRKKVDTGNSSNFWRKVKVIRQKE